MKTETIEIILNIAQVIVSNVVLIIFLIHNNTYRKYIKNNVELTDQMLVYCLTDMKNRYVEAQDYENAARCRELIKKITK